MNVAAIEPDIRGATTIRELLVKHRAEKQCSVCHNRIDPAGCALENYDVIGGFRERYRVVGNDESDAGNVQTKNKNQKQYTLGAIVDPSDTLSSGQSFHSLDEFKQLILENSEPIVRSMVERLLIYSTGHAIEFADRTSIAAIVSVTKESNYGLRSLIHAVVQSEVFLNK